MRAMSELSAMRNAAQSLSAQNGIAGDAADRGRSILVVDGDEGFRELAARVFQRAGYEVLVAATGEEGVEAVLLERPSLVLLDVRLEGMSGYDVCRVLRAHFGDALPIVFVSGDRTEPFDRVAGLRLGADDYLVKPVDCDELLARIDRLVGRMVVGTQRYGTPRTGAALRNLTRREHDVLERLVSGLRPKEIGQDLSISHKTVAVHVQNILVKLGVHSQAQAVAVALSNGLVPFVDGHGAAIPAPRPTTDGSIPQEL
jgi:DNA-binding NarL/FixJ family response regulator